FFVFTDGDCRSNNSHSISTHLPGSLEWTLNTLSTGKTDNKIRSGV
ncbi:unnamed protein product, partial [Allacma fusca]